MSVSPPPEPFSVPPPEEVLGRNRLKDLECAIVWLKRPSPDTVLVSWNCLISASTVSRYAI